MQSITPPAASAPASGVFSQIEYEENTAKVVAHAAATGRALVVGADGRPRVIITIPTQDLPTLDE